MTTNRGHGGLCAKIKLIFCCHMVANVKYLLRMSRRWQNLPGSDLVILLFFVRRFSLTLDCGTPVPLCFYSGAVYLLHFKRNQKRSRGFALQGFVRHNGLISKKLNGIIINHFFDS